MKNVRFQCMNCGHLIVIAFNERIHSAEFECPKCIAKYEFKQYNKQIVIEWLNDFKSINWKDEGF